METAQTFAPGSTVKIVSCHECPQIVGRVVTVKSESSEGLFTLKFGRGRPQKDRPELFRSNQIELVTDGTSL